jgi:hypothetical protein
MSCAKWRTIGGGCVVQGAHGGGSSNEFSSGVGLVGVAISIVFWGVSAGCLHPVRVCALSRRRLLKEAGGEGIALITHAPAVGVSRGCNSGMFFMPNKAKRVVDSKVDPL